MRIEAVIIVFLCGVGMSFGKPTDAQKSAYLKALKPAFYYAYLSDQYRAVADMMFKYMVDVKVTKILTDPPYNEYIKRIQTATPGHPTLISYTFEMKEGEGGTKHLVCSLDLAEFKDDKDFYYVVPYKNNLNCADS